MRSVVLTSLLSFSCVVFRSTECDVGNGCAADVVDKESTPNKNLNDIDATGSACPMGSYNEMCNIFSQKIAEEKVAANGDGCQCARRWPMTTQKREKYVAPESSTSFFIFDTNRIYRHSLNRAWNRMKNLFFHLNESNAFALFLFSSCAKHDYIAQRLRQWCWSPCPLSRYSLGEFSLEIRRKSFWFAL